MKKGTVIRGVTPPTQRFIEKWTLVDNGCWEWTGSRHPRGYGEFFDGSTVVRAHRWAYEQFVGPIPEGLVIDHLCRNTGCVNPLHLEAVTQTENIRRGESPSARYIKKELV